MTQPSASPALTEADRDAALLEEIGFAFARYLSARDMDAVTYGRVRAAVEPIAEEAIALRSDLAAALIQISDLAQAKGEAEGRLRASEMVGVVEGWRDRALKAEAERDEAFASAEASSRLETRQQVRAINAEAKVDQLVSELREAREALKPFADFAHPGRRMPASMPVTNGSPLARRQLTMGDCYAALDALATTRDGGNE